MYVNGRKLTGRSATIGTIGVLILFVAIFGVAFFLLFGYSDIEVNRYEAVIEIQDNGDVIFTERMDMRYRGEDYNVRFWDIDYQKFPSGYNFPYSENNTASFDEGSVQVRVWRENAIVTSNVDIGYSFLDDRDERGGLIRCEPVRNQCESIFVNAQNQGGLYGNYSFEYQYRINGVVTQYSDISEINWVLFEYMEGPIKEGEVTILLPDNAFTVEDLYIFGHGISEGSLEIISNTEVKIHFTNASEKEWLEFRLLMPNAIFEGNIDPSHVFINDGINKALIMEYQENLSNATNQAITIAQVALALSLGVALGLAYLAYYHKKKYFMPHETMFDGDYLRDLPSDETPAEMSYLYYMGSPNNEDVTATLLDLVRRKYITMNHEGQELTSKDASFLLTLNTDKSHDDLLEHEKHLINWFFSIIGDGTKVQTKEIENYGKDSLLNAEKFQSQGTQFIDAVKRIGRKENLMDTSMSASKRRANKYLALPMILAAVIFLVSTLFEGATRIPINNLYSYIVLAATVILYGAFISSQKRRSKEAQERYVKWRAFKNFLTDFGNFQDYPMPGIIVWEHFLVYAVSLKVADKVMQQLSVKLPMNDEMARQSTFMGVGYGRRGFYYGAGFSTFNQTVNRARTNAAKKVSSARSSGSGRGGGFSGGSSFGGGGGGGRSR